MQEIDKRHTVVIQTVKRDIIYLLDKDGNKILRKHGGYRMGFSKNGELLNEKTEKFFSIYNAEARAELINREINEYEQIITTAKVVKFQH